MAGALHERYHDTVILLHTVDRLSPRTLADRFGAGVEEVRAILIAAGALDTSAMRQSNAPPPRQGRPFGTSIQYADPEEREAADIRHVNTVIRTLGGRGFPFLNFGAA